MRRGWAAIASAAGGVLLLVSLYLPWWSVPCPAGRPMCFRDVDGWTGGTGDAAAVLALGVIAAVALGLDSWTLAALGFAAGYLGLGTGVATRSEALLQATGTVHPHLLSGAYLAMAATVLLAIGAAAEAGSPRPGPRGVPAVALAVGLLVALLLPWARFRSGLGIDFARSRGISLPGIPLPPATAAAVLAVGVAALWWRPDPAGGFERLALAVVVAILVGGALVTLPYDRLGGAWVALGLALALPAVALPAALPTPAGLALAVCAATGLVVAGLFLPWQPGGTAGGWSTSATAAALIAVGLAFLVLGDGALPLPAAEAGVAVALLLATSGFQYASGPNTAVRYGAWISLVGGGALVLLSVLGTRVTWPGTRRAVELLAPVAACLAYLFLVLVPSWDVLPRSVAAELDFAELSWLSVAGVLLAVLLLARWLRGFEDWLVAIPLGMLALVSVEAIRLRKLDMTWGRGAVIVLCLALAAMGWIQRRGLPEALHVERIEVAEP